MNKKNRTYVLIGLASLFLIVILLSATFLIREGHQAVITQFGKPVRSVSHPGLHFKTPFIQDIRRIDSRILSWDGYPNQIPTKDKKYIEVDTTARWKITNPLKFIQTVQNEQGARSRLDAILDGITRDIISGNNLVEAVRNSNNIFEVIEGRKNQAIKDSQSASEDRSKKKGSTEDQKAEAALQAARKVIEEPEEITGEIERVQIGREALSQLIIDQAREELIPLGIEIIDVQLKRISYEDSVEKKVYGRMISERQRIAEKIRSYGKGERAKIEGKTQKNLQSIESKAYRQVQIIKGEAEAQAMKIYAQALGQDPVFFRFIRTLEAYEASIPKSSKLILSSDSKFWEVLRNGKSSP